MPIFGFLTSSGGDSAEKFKKASKDLNSLGNILLEKGYITDDILEDAIRIQRSQMQLGKILLKMGVISEDQLDDALFEQRIRRKKVTHRDVMKHHRKKQRVLIDQINGQFKAVATNCNVITGTLSKKAM